MVLSLYGYCSVTPVACASFVHVERRICFSADTVYREIVCEGFKATTQNLKQINISGHGELMYHFHAEASPYSNYKKKMYKICRILPGQDCNCFMKMYK
jgi:hypothetical protein